MSMSIQPRKALVFEPNPYHYTLLPSYIYYLNCLDYNVTLLVHESFSPEKEFDALCLDSNELDCEIINFKNLDLSDIDSDSFLYSYDLVWVTSMITVEKGNWETPFDSMGGYPNPRDGLYGTVHDICIEDNRINKEKFTQLFCLRTVPGPTDYLPISLTYYGERGQKSSPLSTGIKKELTAIGVSVSLRGMLKPFARQQNEDVVLNIIGARAKKSFWRESLIKQLGASFLRARGDYWRGILPLNPRAFSRLKKRVRLLGKLDSPKMYQCLDKTAFLPADFEGKELAIFSKQRVSGIALLSQGFNIPMIANESVARSWGFENDNCVIFPDGCFEEGLRRALSMNAKQYDSMCARLKEKTEADRRDTINAIQLCITMKRAEENCE